MDEISGETTEEPLAEFPAEESWTLRGIDRSVRLDGGVAVGDDGSANARRVLAYAIEEARRRSAPLHVVRAWSRTNAARPDDLPFGVTPSVAEMQEATREQTERRMAEIRAGHDDVEVHVHTALGPAGRVLIEASEGADVLVVGTKGLTGLSGVLIGSVAVECVRRAASPVIVVR